MIAVLCSSFNGKISALTAFKALAAILYKVAAAPSSFSIPSDQIKTRTDQQGYRRQEMNDESTVGSNLVLENSDLERFNVYVLEFGLDISAARPPCQTLLPSDAAESDKSQWSEANQSAPERREQIGVRCTCFTLLHWPIIPLDVPPRCSLNRRERGFIPGRGVSRPRVFV